MSIPVIYAGVMLFKTPTYSDAIIVTALSAMSCAIVQLLMKYNQKGVDSEIAKLEEELHKERLKLSLEQVQQNAIREKAARDIRATAGSYAGNKEIRF